VLNNDPLKHIRHWQGIIDKWSLPYHGVQKTINLMNQHNFSTSFGVSQFVQSSFQNNIINKPEILGFVEDLKNIEYLGVNSYKQDIAFKRLINSSMLDFNITLPESVLEPLNELTPMLETMLPDEESSNPIESANTAHVVSKFTWRDPRWSIC